MQSKKQNIADFVVRLTIRIEDVDVAGPDENHEDAEAWRGAEREGHRGAGGNAVDT